MNPEPQNPEPQNPEFPTAQPGPVGYRRNRLAIFLGVIAAGSFALLIAMIGLVAVGIAAVAAVASGDWEIEAVDIGFVPTALEDLPSTIVEDKAEIEIDLTELDLSELATSERPVELDVDVDYGSITVIVPDDLVVSVDASVDLGSLTVFANSSDGVGNTLVSTDDTADLELELDLDVGKIEVVRG